MIIPRPSLITPEWILDIESDYSDSCEDIAATWSVGNGMDTDDKGYLRATWPKLADLLDALVEENNLGEPSS